MRKQAVLAVIAVLVFAGAFGAYFEKIMSAQANMETAEGTPETMALSVPSGQPIQFLDTVMNQPGFGLSARFRFIAPELKQHVATLSHEALEADLAHLCTHYAVPRLDVSPRPSNVVISLSQQPVPFGEAMPEVMQVFEAYKLTDAGCEWEAF